MPKLAFHTYNLSIRGSEVAIYEYALQHQKVLGGESVIFAPASVYTAQNHKGCNTYDAKIGEKFVKAFGEPYLYNDLEHMDELLRATGCDALHILKSGENDGIVSKVIPTIVHCVFICNQENQHGDIYAGISDCVVGKYYNKPRDLSFAAPVIGHITEGLVTPDGREISSLNTLDFPTDAVVIGRYGGRETFDIPFVKEVIIDIVQNTNICFLFANTDWFPPKHPQIKFIQGVHTSTEKAQFIGACDAMIHARQLGESFGLSIAEFCSMGRPIITFKNSAEDLVAHTAHHDILGTRAMYYSTPEELRNHIASIQKGARLVENPYGKFTAMNVMYDFNDTFLLPLGLGGENVVDKCMFDGKPFYYPAGTISDSGADAVDAIVSTEAVRVLNALSDSDTVLLDIGAGIGSLSVKMCGLVRRVLAVEDKSRACRTLRLNADHHDNISVLQAKVTSLDSDPRVRASNVDIIRLSAGQNQMEALAGITNLLAERKPFIVLIVDSTELCCDPRAMFRQFSEHGYNIHGTQDEREYLASHHTRTDEVTSIFYTIPIQPNNIALPHLSGVTKAVAGVKIKQPEIKVYPMCNWTSSEELVRCWSKMGEPVGKWNNMSLTTNANEADYFVIVNSPPAGAQYDPAKTVVMRMEPDEEYAERWNNWYKDRSDFLAFMNHGMFMNNCEWHLSHTWSELRHMTPEKTEDDCVLAAVISDQRANIGHRLRIEFMQYMQQRQGDVKVHIYGRGNPGFADHRGELPYHAKDRAIYPYKYVFNAENTPVKNYLSEKVFDAILGECLLFYWGCPNVTDFIDERAIILLNLEDKEGSAKIVEEAIRNDEWSKRLPYIRAAKMKILYDMAFMPRLWSLIETAEMKKVVVNLDCRTDRWSNFEKHAQEARLKGYERFSATDGKTEQGDEFRKMVVENSPPQMRCPGVIGCAGSHIRIWRECAAQDLNYAVFEDDATFGERFNDNVAAIYSEASRLEGGWDVIFIGYHVDEKNVPSSTAVRESLEAKWPLKTISSFYNICMQFQPAFGPFHGGTFGYLLSPHGAKKMLRMTERIGMAFPVDYHMMAMSRVQTGGGAGMYCSGDVDIYVANRRAVLSVMFSEDTDIDLKPWLKGTRISRLRGDVTKENGTRN